MPIVQLAMDYKNYHVTLDYIEYQNISLTVQPSNLSWWPIEDVQSRTKTKMYSFGKFRSEVSCNKALGCKNSWINGLL